MGSTARENAVLRLLQSAALPSASVDSYFEQATDRDRWRVLNPSLSIEAVNPGDFPETAALSPEELALQGDQLRREGFFQTGPLLDPVVISQMRECVEGLLAEHWPPVFAFVYDQFWQAMRAPSLSHLVAGFLGDGWRQNALIWTFHVPAIRGAGGWAPHSDDSLEMSRSRLTVWIPLTEASVENGCMYVIPRDRMPASVPSVYSQIAGVTRSELNGLLQAVKALPSAPGALMGWDHQLIHWGSTSTGRTGHRISIAAEFIAGNQTPKVGELPLLDPLRLPSFQERVKIIGNAIVEYGRVEPLMRKFSPLGARLAEL